MDEYGQSIVDYIKNYKVYYHPIVIARNQVYDYFLFDFDCVFYFQVRKCIGEYKQMPERSTLIEEEMENQINNFTIELIDFWKLFIPHG